jgi:multiple sugar transport system permease protein
LKRLQKTPPSFSNIIAGLSLSVITLIILLPLFWLLVSSLKPAQEIIQYPPGFFPTTWIFDHYRTVWKTLPLFTYGLNTIIFAGGVTLSSLVLDTMAGYAFARLKFRFKRTLYAIILITMMIPFQVIMIPLFIETYLMGILDTYIGLILPRASSAFGIFLMQSFFVSLPRDLEEAARIDGLDEYRIFLRIMVPLCTPALLTLGIILFMNNWNDLLYPLMMTSSTSMRTLPAGLAVFVGDKVISYGPTFAASVLSILPLLLLFAGFQKYFIQGVATTGMKS